jgi:hypothetical protein
MFVKGFPDALQALVDDITHGSSHEAQHFLSVFPPSAELMVSSHFVEAGAEW